MNNPPVFPPRNLGPGENWGREVERLAKGSDRRLLWVEASVRNLNSGISGLQTLVQSQIAAGLNGDYPRFIGRTLYVDGSSTIPDNRDTKPVSAFGYSMNVSGSAVAVGHDISWSGPPSIIVSDGVADSPHEPGVILLGSDRPSGTSSSIRNIVVGDGNQWVGSPDLPIGGAITIGSGNRSNRLFNTILGHENEVLGALAIVIGYGNQVTDVDEQGGVTIGNQISNLGTQCTAIGYSLVDSGVLGSTAIDGSVYHDDCFALGAGTTEQRQVSIGDRHIELREDRGHNLTPAPSNPLHGRVYYYEGDLWLATASKRINLSDGSGGGGGQGPPGKSAYEVAVDNGFVGTAQQWLDSLAGADGKSAYQSAVDGGFIGTEAQWIASLVGADGKSAYQIAVDNGFLGTEPQWIASLKGSDGNPGDDGASAYEIAVANGFTGTEQEWLESLKGADGTPAVAPVNGTVTLTAPTGGGEVEVTVEFPPGHFTKPPRVLVSLETRVPFTSVANVSADTIGVGSAQVVLNRSDDTPTVISWFAVPATDETPAARPWPDTFYPDQLYPE